jgi:hypothetical protein
MIIFWPSRARPCPPPVRDAQHGQDSTRSQSRHPRWPPGRHHDHDRPCARPECPIPRRHRERPHVDILSVGEHMRDSYKAETQWAPPHVGQQLRGVRLAAENARQLAIRSHAEAQAATDQDTAARHARMATSAGALQDAYRPIEASLDEAMDDRRAWEQITAGPRRLAVAADSELRRRHPGQPIEPLRSAEPRVPEDDEITKPADAAKPAEPREWVTGLAEHRHAFQEKLAERQNVMVPEENPDYGFLGPAWPWQERDADAILQPPKPELRPYTWAEPLAGYDLPDREAAD